MLGGQSVGTELVWGLDPFLIRCQVWGWRYFPVLYAVLKYPKLIEEELHAYRPTGTEATLKSHRPAPSPLDELRLGRLLTPPPRIRAGSSDPPQVRPHPNPNRTTPRTYFSGISSTCTLCACTYSRCTSE